MEAKPKFIPLIQLAESPRERAGIKLGWARAVIDLVFTLDQHEESALADLDVNTVGNAMVLVRELIDDACALIGKSEAGHHG